MAKEKDNRKIHRGVRTHKGTFVAGQEDELAEVLTPDQVEDLTERGAIEGDWKAGGEPAPPMRGSRLARGEVAPEEGERGKRRQASRSAGASHAGRAAEGHAAGHHKEPEKSSDK